MQTQMIAATQPKSVTDYLDALTWDGTPRIDRWLVDYAGAEDTPYVRGVSRAMLVAAVRRARHPGSPLDQVLVLEGPQGCGKSTALRVLAADDAWFTDALPSVKDARQVIEATAGKWIVEDSELAAKMAAAGFKAFLSATHDEARLAYQRESTRVPRSFVVVGTTNATDDYLRDATGNRRFWPVRVRRFDLERLAAARDQLWAEAAGASIDSVPPETQTGTLSTNGNVKQAIEAITKITKILEPLSPTDRKRVLAFVNA